MYRYDIFIRRTKTKKKPDERKTFDTIDDLRKSFKFVYPLKRHNIAHSWNKEWYHIEFKCKSKKQTPKWFTKKNSLLLKENIEENNIGNSLQHFINAYL